MAAHDEEAPAPIVGPVVQALREVADAVGAVRDVGREITVAAHRVAHTVDSLRPFDAEPPGYQSELRAPRALEVAFRFCRFRDEAGVWHGLAQLAKPVPAEHVGRACTVGRGPECWVVRCPCGAVEFVASALVECRGGDACRRWFVADGAGVWSMRLPEGQEPFEERPR